MVYLGVLTFSLIRTRATSLDSQLLGIDMRRNKVNKWAWRKRFRFSTTFYVPFSGISAVYDGVSAHLKRLALERALALSVTVKYHSQSAQISILSK